MAVQKQPDLASRLIITRKGAAEVLVSTQLSPWALPQLDVLAETRPAEQLVEGVRRNFQLETCFLFSKSLSSLQEPSFAQRYAVLEVVHENNQQAPAATRWISSTADASQANLARADRAAIRNLLEELNRNIADPSSGPFAKPGWMKELFGWIHDQIEPLGLHLTGGFRQLNASPTFSLVRFETTGSAVWFKATGEPNTHELPLSIALHRTLPNYVPRILGVRPSWNAWLYEEVPGPLLGECKRAGAWSEAAKALAELQIASISKTDLLLENKCKDLGLARLAQQIDPFLARVSEVMAVQTKQRPQVLTDSEIRALGDRLQAAFYELRRCGLPETLGHLDCNPRNILVSPGRCCFLDWAEGCVTHPLFTFAYLREHFRRSAPEPGASTEPIVNAYLLPWQSFFSPKTLSQAMALSPLLAVFAYAVASGKWCSPETIQNPALAGYFRSLARRAYREANEIAPGSNRCLV